METQVKPRSAFESEELDAYRKTIALKVNSEGSPTNLITEEAKEDTPSVFWQMHEKWLWLMIVFCSIYFLSILGAV